MFVRIVDRQRKELLAWSSLVAAAAVAMYVLYGLWVIAVIPGVVLTYLVVRPGAGGITMLFARTPISLRWKTSGIIFVMLGVLLAVSLVSLALSQYVHREIHTIQDLQDSAPLPAVNQLIRNAEGPQSELVEAMQVRFRQIPASLERLEDIQHAILKWTPWIVFGGGLIAVGLGVALSSLLLRPLERMGEATRRIANGNFSQPVVVPNRDEIGELADNLNSAARDLSRLQEALLAEERAKSLQDRLAQATLAQEEERRRISRELHDGLGPALADLANRLSVCRQLVPVDAPKAQEGLDEATGLLRTHISEIRELINELRPLALDQLGLVEALEQYIERFRVESGIEASLHVSGSLNINPLVDVTIYRVVQESLTNVRKHSQASAVQVELRTSDGMVEAEVADDGQGFDPSTVVTSAEKGLGLTSMRERAELAGGTFTVQSNPGQGCRTFLSIPVRG